MESRTLGDLNTKKAYRFIKAVYIFFYVISIGYLIACIFDSPNDSKVIVGWIAGLIIVFELIRRAFYYIALGTIIPKSRKDENLQTEKRSMKSFKLEKQSRNSVAGVFIFSLILGIFFHGALLATIISGIVWLYMTFSQKEKL